MGITKRGGEGSLLASYPGGARIKKGDAGEAAKGDKAHKGKEGSMRGFIVNIEKATLENDNFRTVLYTAYYSQLVLMSLKPGEEIGEEVHGLDQFIRIEQGRGRAVLDGESSDIEDDYALVIPAGTRHNIINTSDREPLKLYSIYSPPEHEHATVHATKADAVEEHFDGRTSVEEPLSRKIEVGSR